MRALRPFRGLRASGMARSQVSTGHRRGRTVSPLDVVLV